MREICDSVRRAPPDIPMKKKLAAQKFEFVVVVGFVMRIRESENVGDVCHGSHG